jgi:hypothetical protein
MDKNKSGSNNNNGETLDVRPTVQADAAPKVIWDDSKMQTSYANVCNVLGTREEIMLLFGANQAWQGGQKEVTVLLSDRIVLNPFAAKRLLVLLGQGLKEYESRYGELKV